MGRLMQVLAFSGDLLASLTHAVSHPLAVDLYVSSLRGVDSVYGGLLEYLEQEVRGPSGVPRATVRIMITALISEGLLATVLDKTLLYCQEKGSQTSTKAAKLLLHQKNTLVTQ